MRRVGMMGSAAAASGFGAAKTAIDQRYHCDVSTVINHADGNRTLAKLVNFSRGGCRVAGFIALAVDEIVGIETRGCARQPARVAWVIENVAGCQFLAPLPAPALQAWMTLAGSVDRS